MPRIDWGAIEAETITTIITRITRITRTTRTTTTTTATTTTTTATATTTTTTTKPLCLFCFCLTSTLPFECPGQASHPSMVFEGILRLLDSKSQDDRRSKGRGRPHLTSTLLTGFLFWNPGIFSFLGVISQMFGP